jgi:GntR family transcriptional regulator
MEKRKPDSAKIQMPTLDRSSYEPAYIQLVNILKKQIANGQFRASNRLPSESELCAQFKVSPMTVRRAINILAEQGIVVTERGRGTFVKQPRLGTATFHLREMQTLLGDPSLTNVSLLGVNLTAADDRVAEKLKKRRGEKVIYIRRLLNIDGEPAFYHREYIVYDARRPILEAEMEVTSLEGLFSGRGSSVFKVGELTVSATLMDEEEARILKVKAPASAMSLTHLFFDYDDRPVSWGWFICRSDKLLFKTKVGIQ